MIHRVISVQVLGSIFLLRALDGQAAARNAVPYADSFAGVDIGAKTNAAFARCQQMPGLCLGSEPNRAYTFFNADSISGHQCDAGLQRIHLCIFKVQAMPSVPLVPQNRRSSQAAL